MTTLQGARRAASIIAVTTLLVAGTTGLSFAHHGWDWADAKPTELSGIITSITIAPPHPVIEIHADGQMWTVELGNPALTERSGFVEGSAEVGQEITVLGNRAGDGALRMKAVRVTVNGRTYDIYPDRIPAN
jgi:Family of unknown function (DUF6152)